MHNSAQGIFATHLHKLLELPLRTRHLTRMAMETAPEADGRYVRPTWRMAPGHCTNSLALSVALSVGIAPAIVDEAQRMTQVPAATFSSPPAIRAPHLLRACLCRHDGWVHAAVRSRLWPLQVTAPVRTRALTLLNPVLDKFQDWSRHALRVRQVTRSTRLNLATCGN